MCDSRVRDDLPLLRGAAGPWFRWSRNNTPDSGHPSQPPCKGQHRQFHSPALHRPVLRSSTPRRPIAHKYKQYICCGSFPHIRCLPRRSHRPSAALSPGLEPRGRCFSTTTESRSAHMTGRTRQLLRVHESMNFAKSSASLRPCPMRRQCSADSKNGPAPSS